MSEGEYRDRAGYPDGAGYLDEGTSVRKVLRVAGQPHRRLDETFTYCAKTRSGATAKVKVFFDGRGRVTRTR